MKKKIFPILLTLLFLLNMAPVEAALFDNVFDGPVFDSVFKILSVIFRVKDSSTDALVLMVRIALFMLVLAIGNAVINTVWDDQGYGAESNSSPLVISLILAWATSVAFSAQTLMSIYGLYSGLVIAILFLIPVLGLLYLNYYLLDEYLGANTFGSVVAKIITYVIIIISLGAMTAAFSDLARSGSSQTRDIAGTFASVAGLAIIVFIFILIYQIFKLISFAFGGDGTTNTIGHIDHDLHVLDGLTKGVRDVAEDVQDPEVRRLATEIADEVEPVVAAAEQAINAVEENPSDENIQKLRQTQQQLEQLKQQLNDEKIRTEQLQQKVVQNSQAKKFVVTGINDVNKNVDSTIDVSKKLGDYFKAANASGVKARKKFTPVNDPDTVQVIDELTQSFQIMASSVSNITDKLSNLYKDIDEEENKATDPVQLANNVQSKVNQILQEVSVEIEAIEKRLNEKISAQKSKIQSSVSSSGSDSRYSELLKLFAKHDELLAVISELKNDSIKIKESGNTLPVLVKQAPKSNLMPKTFLQNLKSKTKSKAKILAGKSDDVILIGEIMPKQNQLITKTVNSLLGRVVLLLDTCTQNERDIKNVARDAAGYFTQLKQFIDNSNADLINKIRYVPQAEKANIDNMKVVGDWVLNDKTKEIKKLSNQLEASRASLEKHGYKDQEFINDYNVIRAILERLYKSKKVGQWKEFYAQFSKANRSTNKIINALAKASQ